MDRTVLEARIAQGESLTQEFKGEERAALNDRDLVEAVICLANSDGGLLFIGVEDDGRVTGARPRHGSQTDTARLQALIRGRTVPGIEVSVEKVAMPQGEVLCLTVPRSSSVAASSDGVCLRRMMGAHGPECVPYYPHQHAGRGTALGAEDFSAQLCHVAGWRALDPLQFERARQRIAALRGDTALLELDDREMAKTSWCPTAQENQGFTRFRNMLVRGLYDHLWTFMNVYGRIVTHKSAG